MKSILGKLSGALCLAAILLTLPASGAVDMFLNLGPTMPGESVDSVHKGQVDVLAWSWGMTNTGTTHISGGGGAGTNNFQDLLVTKYVDKASPPLMLALAKGTHIATVTLFVRRAGTTPIEFIKIIMTDVLVTSVSNGGSGGEDRLTENISLNFAQVQFNYTPTKPDGSADTMIPFRWNIADNISF